MRLEFKPSKTRPSALQHGARAETLILPGEDPHEFDRLHRGLIKEWSPSGPAEKDAVFTLAKCIWRKRRIGNLRQEVTDDGRMHLISAIWSLVLHGRLGHLGLGDERVQLLGIFDSMPEEDTNLISALIYKLRKKMAETAAAEDSPDGPEEDGFSLVEPLLTKAISIADGFSMTRLANELALEERLDRMIDRALRRLCQMKAVNRPDTECAESAHPRRCTGSPNRSTIDRTAD